MALAVVGPIASGKTVVLRMLADLGAATCSADGFAHELTEPGQPTLSRILQEFGGEYERPDGSLDRARLAQRIFGDAEARERLEGILHPLILERIRGWLAELRARPQAPSVAAVEVLRLPEELEARGPFDVVWLCSAPRDVRLRRLMERDGLSRAEAERRIAVQATQDIEGCRPDLVLHTGGEVTQVGAAVRRAWQGLREAGAPR